MPVKFFILIVISLLVTACEVTGLYSDNFAPAQLPPLVITNPDNNNSWYIYRELIKLQEQPEQSDSAPSEQSDSAPWQLRWQAAISYSNSSLRLFSDTGNRWIIAQGNFILLDNSGEQRLQFSINNRSIYPISKSVVATEQARIAALNNLSKNLAQQVWQRLIVFYRNQQQALPE